MVVPRKHDRREEGGFVIRKTLGATNQVIFNVLGKQECISVLVLLSSFVVSKLACHSNELMEYLKHQEETKCMKTVPLLLLLYSCTSIQVQECNSSLYFIINM